MKKLIVLLLSFWWFAAQAQKSTDAKLNSRLQTYMSASQQLDFDKVMDLMHPRLFTVAPREQLIETMEQAFNNPQLTIRFDSMRVLAISPAFQLAKETYRKVDYFMQMTITLNDSLDLRQQALSDAMKKSFSAGFPGKEVQINPEKNTIHVAGLDLMFAIKGPGVVEWMFLGYEKKNPQLLKHLYPQQVRQHFGLL